MDQTLVGLTMGETENSSFPGLYFFSVKTALVVGGDEKGGVAPLEPLVQVQDKCQFRPPISETVIAVRPRTHSRTRPRPVDVRSVRVRREVPV